MCLNPQAQDHAWLADRTETVVIHRLANAENAEHLMRKIKLAGRRPLVEGAAPPPFGTVSASNLKVQGDASGDDTTDTGESSEKFRV